MNGMALPPGKTCGDCRHYRRCEMLFRCRVESVECDWSPHRFADKGPVDRTEIVDMIARGE